MKKKQKAVESSLEQAIDNLKNDLVKEIELLKSVVHKCTSDLDFFAIHPEAMRNHVKENSLQIVENNKRIDALRTELKNEIRNAERNIGEKIDELLNNHEARTSSTTPISPSA